MVRKVNKLIVFLLVFAICITHVPSAASAEITTEPIFQASNMSFSSGTDGVAIPSATVSQLAALGSGTIIAEYTPTTTTVASSLISISNSTTANGYFHVYIDNRGFLGIEVRNASDTRYVNLQGPIEVISNERHTIALSADSTDGYKFYYDGALVFEMPIDLFELWDYDYAFMSYVDSADVGYVGATYRNGTMGYPFYGTIHDIRVYSTALDQETLEEETYQASDPGIIKQERVFSIEQWNTKGIRIPAILKTSKGTIIATGDIRYGDAAGTSNDPPNNCDIGVRVSNDNGATWSTPQMLLNFLDYPNEPQVPIQKDSASYCDSVLVEGENGRVFFFGDAMTGQVRAPYAAASTGYTTDGKLILLNSSGTQYELDETTGKVYLNDVETTYTVGSDFTLYKDGQVAGNIFYYNYGTYSETDMPKKTELRVVNTVFLVMCYSDDGGYTWSAPKLMNFGLKTSDMKHFGAAPGIGITIQTGKDAGRIIVPIYYNSSTYSGMSGAVLYSDDNGTTWSLSESPNDAREDEGLDKISMGEIQIIEMPSEGDTVSTQLKMFVRQSGGVLIATSYDGGITWDSEMPLESELVAPVPYGGCQQSVINYSSLVEGKPAVVFANAAANSRSNGTIRIGLIEENGTNNDGRINYEFDWKYERVIRAGEFGYSSLMELDNGNIVCFYEQESRPDNIYSLMYGEYTLDYLTYVEPVVEEPNLVYSAREQTLPDANGAYVELDDTTVEQLASLDKGTILVRFTPTNASTYQSLIGISNSQAGYPNSHFHLYYSANRLGFEIRRQSGGDFEKNYASVTIENGKEYCAAITADPNYGYQLFLNGSLVLDLPIADLTTTSGYGFISDIPDIDTAFLGKTGRTAAAGATTSFEYPANVTIHTIQIFDGAFSEDYMEQVTYVAADDAMLYNNNNVTISESADAVALDSATVTSLAAMSSGTVVIEFTPQITSVHSLFSVSNNSSGYDNSHFHIYVRSGVVGYEIRQQSGGDFCKSSATVSITAGEKHILAFVADASAGYKIFFDGELVNTVLLSELSSPGYGFLSSISGLNSAYLGMTDRATGNDYPYVGTIENIKVFNTVIPDYTLVTWTNSGGF